MIKPENLEFLVKLDNEVHYTTYGQMYLMGKPGHPLSDYQYPVDNFRNERKLKREEIEKITQILLSEQDLFVYPEEVGIHGLGYKVVSVEQTYPGVTPKIKTLLAFLENQLPKEWDFNRLTPIMKIEKNKNGLKFYNLPGVKHREAYSL